MDMPCHTYTIYPINRYTHTKTHTHISRIHKCISRNSLCFASIVQWRIPIEFPNGGQDFSFFFSFPILFFLFVSFRFVSFHFILFLVGIGALVHAVYNAMWHMQSQRMWCYQMFRFDSWYEIWMCVCEFALARGIGERDRAAGELNTYFCWLWTS